MTTAAEDRTLILVRHAEAVDRSPDGDHERELTERGMAQAEEAGRWLHEHGIGVDEALCSTAARARQTAEGLWAGGCPEAEVHHLRQLYNGSSEAILAVLREADPDANVVMVVGHAPGIPALASVLADGEGSAAAHRALAEGFPPCGMAVLTYQGHWRDLGAEDATLTRLHLTTIDAAIG